MPTNITIFLDTRYKRKDDTSPVLMRLIRDRKNITIPVGIYIEAKSWNASKSQIKKNSRMGADVTRLNNFIQKKRTNAFDVINKLIDDGKYDSMTLKEIKKLILDKKDVPSLFEYTESIIQGLKEAMKIGNANSYNAMLVIIKGFQKNKDIELRNITYAYLKKFENYYYGKGNSTNGLACVLKTLRAVCNRAIREKIMPRDWYPFEEYRIKKVPTKKRAVSKEVITAIEQLDLEKDSPIWLAQQLFLFSFYTAGLPLIDLSHLRFSDIVDNRVEYSRKKTAKPHRIKLIPKAEKIVDEFRTEDAKDRYIFPIIKHLGNAEEEYNDVRLYNKVLNKYLKRIGNMVDCPIPLTSYVARHTYATEAKRLGLSTEIISELLNHEDLKTTQTYLASLENNVLDQANDLITG